MDYNKQFYRLKKVAEMTSLSTTTLRRYIKKGILDATLIGNNFFVKPIDYDKFLLKLEFLNKGFDINKFDEIVKYLKQMEMEEEKEMLEAILSKFNSSEEKKDLIDTILGIK